MKERRKIGEREKELLPFIVEYVKRNKLEKEDGLAIALLCNSELKAEKMLNYLKQNPDITFDKLLEKAVEIYQSDKN